MAISTLDGVIAGMGAPQNFMKTTGTMEAAGVFHSPLYAAGLPGAGSANAAGLAGAALTSLTGQLPFTNPVSGSTYIARFEAAASVVGTLYLVDRLWHNSGFTITTTTAQTVNSVAFPARDINGATAGDGVMVGIEVSTATTNGSAVTNTTMTYTNSAGTASRTATMPSFPATAVAGTFVPFNLAAGDVGVQSIQSLTLGTSYAAGTIHLVAYRVLATLGITTANVAAGLDALTLGFPRLYDNTVPTLLWLATATTTTNIYGRVTYTQG